MFKRWWPRQTTMFSCKKSALILPHSAWAKLLFIGVGQYVRDLVMIGHICTYIWSYDPMNLYAIFQVYVRIYLILKCRCPFDISYPTNHFDCKISSTSEQPELLTLAWRGGGQCWRLENHVGHMALFNLWLSRVTLPKTNSKGTWPENWWLEEIMSVWDGLFSGAILVSGRV